MARGAAAMCLSVKRNTLEKDRPKGCLDPRRGLYQSKDQAVEEEA